MSRHTPGPWKYDGSNNITADFMSVGICILEPLAEFWCGDVARHPEGEEYQANARLIAAAPDLLAACEETLEALENEGYEDKGPTYIVTRLKALIRKAKGS